MRHTAIAAHEVAPAAENFPRQPPDARHDYCAALLETFIFVPWPSEDDYSGYSTTDAAIGRCAYEVASAGYFFRRRHDLRKWFEAAWDWRPRLFMVIAGPRLKLLGRKR